VGLWGCGVCVAGGGSYINRIDRIWSILNVYVSATAQRRGVEKHPHGFGGYSRACAH